MQPFYQVTLSSTCNYQVLYCIKFLIAVTLGGAATGELERRRGQRKARSGAGADLQLSILLLVSQMSSGMCQLRYVSMIGWLGVVGVVETRLI